MTGNLFENLAPSESTSDWFTAHCDGGSRGNPGPSGYGAVVEDAQGQGRCPAEPVSRHPDQQLRRVLRPAGGAGWAIENGAKRLRVVSDSELMVKQMKGQYKVKSPGLVPLGRKPSGMAARLDGFEMRHTLRGGNKEADRLANEAMDKGMGRSRE